MMILECECCETWKSIPDIESRVELSELMKKEGWSTSYSVWTYRDDQPEMEYID